MTQLEFAQRGIVTDVMKNIAEKEGITIEEIIREMLKGALIIPYNLAHSCTEPCAIGDIVSTKVEANFGTSPDKIDLQLEHEKLKAAIKYGANLVMDLSLGGDIDANRRESIKNATVPIGSVPIYQAAVEAAKNNKTIVNMREEDILEVMERQARDGIDFMTIHAGVTRWALELMNKQGRISKICSRGGSLLAEWMLHNNSENPYYKNFDRVLEIAKKYDVTLSLGSGLRSGCISDATDRAQVEETITVGHLRQRCMEYGVQSMVEGPGHMRMNEIKTNMQLIKKLCYNAPIYVLGPLPADATPGYDNITGAIGGAIAVESGANLLCYVTPTEHVGLPDIEDVRMGIVSSRIAAHSGDISKGLEKSLAISNRMARARYNLEWDEQRELSIDPSVFQDKLSRYILKKGEGCSMCGEFCAYKTKNA